MAATHGERRGQTDVTRALVSACSGFRVQTRHGFIGDVEELVFGADGEIAGLLVRGGVLDIRRFVLDLADVVAVRPTDRTVVVRNIPGEGLLEDLRAQLRR